MSEEIKVNVSGGSIGFFGLLTIVLIALKLTGQITLSWLWIIAIPFIPVAIFICIWLALLAIAFIGAIVVVIYKYFEDRNYRRSK